jgi:hypothetical protein
MFEYIKLYRVQIFSILGYFEAFGGILSNILDFEVYFEAFLSILASKFEVKKLKNKKILKFSQNLTLGISILGS